MKNLGSNSRNKQSAKDIDRSFIGAAFETNTSNRVESLELFQASSSDCGRHSRVTARTFTSPNHSAVANSHPFDFIGMNASAVITTGGLGGEGVNLVSGNCMNDVHSESSINFLHFMPADFETLQRVNNQKSLIKENNFGMNENNVKNVADHQAPRDGARSVSESVINNVDVNQSANSKECAESHDVTTSWSKGLQIRHLAIISRNEIEKERRAA